MKFCILFRGAKWKINRPQALKHPQTLPIIVCAKNCWSISISSPADWEQHPVTAASTWNVCFLLLFMINLKVCWGFFQSDQSTNLPFFFLFFYIPCLRNKTCHSRYQVKVFIQTVLSSSLTSWHFTHWKDLHTATEHGCLPENRVLAEVRVVEEISAGSLGCDAWSIRPGPREPQRTHIWQREIAARKSMRT